MPRVYKRKDYIGQKFNRLTILQNKPDIRHDNTNIRVVEVVCDCGTVYDSRLAGILSGSVKSCGCLHSEKSSEICVQRNTTHGDSGSKEHLAWKAMIARCYNDRRSTYHLYGGRGIGVCDRWRSSYEAFLDDMGRAPDSSNMWSVGRKDNNNDYSPENCCWEIWDEQARNRGMQCNNTSGRTGVSRRVQKGRYATWVAHWHEGGKAKSKSFSVLKYGEDKALQLACNYRDQMIANMNAQGAGYTDTHGLPREIKETK